MNREFSYARTGDDRDATIEDIHGSCPEIVELRSRLRRLCRLEATAAPTVLITGETGTGKGLVARSLHHGGARAHRSFIEINCAAIPENLVESELFGHEKGAFTDARSTSIGLFAGAHRGTLFLDEIGCLPPPIQVKLLKAIEEKTIRPVGSGTSRPVDVQIVAATNGDLAQMVADGRFRRDLYHRLSVARLEVPPLRGRGDDIPLLARRFLDELFTRYRTPPKRLTRDAEEWLHRHSWPGNVRELRNTLERAVLFCEDETIDAMALGRPVGPMCGAVDLTRDPSGELEVTLPDGGLRFDELERAVLLGALRSSGGSQSGAARLLGMTRATLRYRLEKFGITGTETVDCGPSRG